MRIGSIVSNKGGEVVTIEPGATVNDAVDLLAEEGVGALVVSRDGKHIVGIISERDVVRRLCKDQEGTLRLKVEDLMTKEVVTCTAEDTVDALMAVMTENRIRHVPVAEDGELTGIVSIGDIVKWRLLELEDEARHLKDYLTTGR